MIIIFNYSQRSLSVQTVQRWVPPHGTIETLMVKWYELKQSGAVFSHAPLNALVLWHAAVHFFMFSTRRPILVLEFSIQGNWNMVHNCRAFNDPNHWTACVGNAYVPTSRMATHRHTCTTNANTRSNTHAYPHAYTCKLTCARKYAGSCG